MLDSLVSAFYNTLMSREESILKAATSLFARKGFSATPTSVIAKEAGGASGTTFLSGSASVIQGMLIGISRLRLLMSVEAPCLPTQATDFCIKSALFQKE